MPSWLECLFECVAIALSLCGTVLLTICLAYGFMRGLIWIFDKLGDL